jgi:hypothetical protein
MPMNGKLAALILVACAAPAAAAVNDYPAVARAAYVFGCMASNGETREALDKCSCSIDVIATIITYDSYVAAETTLSMGQLTGENGALFRQSEPARQALNELRRAQAEAEVRCF